MCRAEVNGEVPKHEKFTVLEIKTDEIANKKISEFQTEKLRFLGDKECRSSEKLHVDSLCHAEANGDVRVQEKSTVSAPETGKVPNPKLQAVINAVDHYDNDMEELAHQHALDPDFRQLLNDAVTVLEKKGDLV